MNCAVTLRTIGLSEMRNALVLLLSAVITGVLCFPVRRLLVARGIMDSPGERSSHTKATARGGGIAMMLTVVIGGVILFFASGETIVLKALGIATLLAIVSFLDDLRSVHPLARLACHALAGIGLLWSLHLPAGPIRFDPDLGLELSGPVAFLIFLVWIAGYTNAFNFMDGINGIAGTQAFLTGVGTALIAGFSTGNWEHPAVILSLIIAGAALGFLPHNFPNARMFMGDVSSAPLGLLLSFLTLWVASANDWRLLGPLVLLHANFILDTGITLARRIIRGEKWYLPHREHFYQRFIRAGKSHAYVALWEVSLQCIVLLVLFVYLNYGPWARLLSVAAVLMVWLVFFGCAEIALKNALRQSQSPVQLRRKTVPA
jgi:UDP-N-acetylmuramyl pentapeptide phosphotransferase/UDP-N-acetylglucosamine-1-phosphate transferase